MRFLAGKGKAVAPDPIQLTIYSPSVPNLTLVDMPGEKHASRVTAKCQACQVLQLGCSLDGSALQAYSERAKLAQQLIADTTLYIRMQVSQKCPSMGSPGVL